MYLVRLGRLGFVVVNDAGEEVAMRHSDIHAKAIAAKLNGWQFSAELANRHPFGVEYGPKRVAR